MKKLTFNFPSLNCRASLQEMYSIFWESPAYEFFRGIEQMERPASFEGYEMSYDLPWETPSSPLLYRHIVAEQLFSKGEKWTEGFPRDYFHVGMLLKLANLWLHPLTWDYDFFYEKIVVDGRVAKERYAPEREDVVRKMVRNQQVKYLLDFADEFPICEEEDPQHGNIKGLHYWSLLTWNLDPIFDKVLDGGDYSEDEFAKTKSYDAAFLRKNLAIIAKNRGGKRAAEILYELQKEWKQIKIWKSDSDNISEQEMRVFEESIFHGFDDLLAEWEQETEQSNTRGPKETTVFKDSETAKREKERFMSFINRHKMSEDDVDAAWDNRVNQVTVCFYRIWKEKNMLTAKAGGTSLSRFIIDCGLSISVKEKAHGNALNRMINSDDLFTNWIGEVRASFQK